MNGFRILKLKHSWKDSKKSVTKYNLRYFFQIE